MKFARFLVRKIEASRANAAQFAVFNFPFWAFRQNNLIFTSLFYTVFWSLSPEGEIKL